MPHDTFLRSGRLAPLALFLALVPLTGCSSSGPVAGAHEPGPGMVQFTSADGFLTINVPDDWQECTSVAFKQMSTTMGGSVPGMSVPAAWDLDGDFFYGGALVLIVSHPTSPFETDAEEVATQAWTALQLQLQEVVADFEFDRQADFITSDGRAFKRMDITLTMSGETKEMIQMVSIFDEIGVEITVTLVGEALDEKDDVLESLETLVFD